MYVLFVNPLTKVYVLRYARGDAAYTPPDDDSITVDDSIEGFLDSVARARERAVSEGWRNWSLAVEDCP